MDHHILDQPSAPADQHKCNRCRKMLPIAVFPRKPSLIRTKRCLPCTEHEAMLRAGRKARKANNVTDTANIDPVTNSTKSKPQNPKKEPPTISLPEMVSLLETSRGEAFDFEAYVALPMDTFSPGLSLRDQAFVLRDMIYKSSKYRFK